MGTSGDRTMRAARMTAAGALATLAALAAAPAADAAFPGENGEIAFTREFTVPSGGDIRTIEPDGSAETSLTPNTTYHYAPSYSPDGSRITFYGNLQNDGNYDVYTMNADGSDLLRLTTDPGFDSEPAFSQDGSKIFFQTNRDGNDEIYSMNTDGSGETNLTNDAASDQYPAVSPETGQVVFASTRVGDDLDLFSMGPDGSDVTQLTAAPGPDYLADFSPDGSKLVFISSRDGGEEVYAIDSDGTNPTRLTNTPPGDRNQMPVFSPDGTQIALAAQRAPDGFQIYRMNADGSGLTRLTNNFGNDLYPGWRPIVECSVDNRSASRKPASDPAPEVAELSASMAAKDARVQATGDGDGGPPRLAEVVPDEAVAGAAVLLRGRNLAAESLRATVGGRRARIAQARDRSLLVRVPNLRPGAHRMVLRRGEHRVGARLRVLRPFDGTLGAELDTANATSATVGPGGGELATTGADGTSYRLAIPAGAIAEDTEVALTPVKRFTGLPFSGDDVAGAELTPDGLTLAVDATLTIRGAHRFDGSTVGFGSEADGFELTEPAGLGRKLVLTISHFSEHGGSEAEAADAANSLKPFIERRGPLSRAAIRQILNQVAIFDRRFSPPQDLNNKPPTFCTRQPVCRQVFAKAGRSMEQLIDERCALAARNPTLFAFREVVGMQSELDLLGGDVEFSHPCRDGIATATTDAVLTALERGPLDAFRAFELPEGVSGDVDGDGLVSAWEMAEALAGEFSFIGPVNDDEGKTRDLPAELRAARDRALEAILTDAAARCEADGPGAIADLRRGLAYARRIGHLEAAYLDALRACGVAIVVVPAQAQLEPEAKQLFEALLTNPDAEDAGGVDWSATGGALRTEERADRFFAELTAPADGGTLTVRATSTANPERFSTALVTVVEPGC